MGSLAGVITRVVIWFLWHGLFHWITWRSCDKWISIMGRLLLMWYNRAKCLLILSFIYLFVSLFAHTSIRVYRVHVFKKKNNVTCRSSGRQNGLTCIFFFFFFFFFFCYGKDTAQTFRVHMHMLVWNLGGHMCSWMPSHVSPLLLLRPRDLDQTAQMYMHAHADLELCWSDVSRASHYVSLKFFGFFLQKSWLAHISLTFICCKDPDQTVWMLILLSYQTSLIPHSTWDNK